EAGGRQFHVEPFCGDLLVERLKLEPPAALPFVLAPTFQRESRTAIDDDVGEVRVTLLADGLEDLRLLVVVVPEREGAHAVRERLIGSEVLQFRAVVPFTVRRQIPPARVAWLEELWKD